MGCISARLLRSWWDRGLERTGLEGPVWSSPFLPAHSPGLAPASFVMNKPVLFIAHNCQISRRP